MYIKIENGAVAAYPYTLDELRLSNPNVSFPKDPAPGSLEPWGVYNVLPSARPTADSNNFWVEEVTPVYTDGAWTQAWAQHPYTSEQTVAITDQLAAKARADRNRRLQECDWTQARDVQLVDDSAWTTYRQALRDITEQPGFPHTIEFYLREAVNQDRQTTALRLSEAGHPELVPLLGK